MFTAVSHSIRFVRFCSKIVNVTFSNITKIQKMKKDYVMIIPINIAFNPWLNRLLNVILWFHEIYVY